ncbi:MAG: 2-oxoglutarate dehydrogenase complex dihydrolipoyllysine-residue succinyltransferase, partial [Acidobacteria bacterium]
GILSRIERQEGENVKVGDVLGIVEEAEEAVAVTEKSEEKTAEGVHEPPPEVPEPAATAAVREAPARPSVRATPSARRMAREHAVDLESVPGSGPSGQITREDVQSYLQQQRVEAAPPQPTPVAGRPRPEEVPAPTPTDRARREERIRMSRRRQTIARRLVEAQRTAAMLTTFNEVDMSAVMQLRQRYKEAFKQRHGVSLGITSFFVKASIAALKEFPQLNAEIQGDEIVLKYYYDIGVAVGASAGLVVPVLRDADRMSFADIEKAIKEFARKAEEGTLTLEDLRGGTFTVTNGGVFGSLLSTPILNPPQVGILGLHKVEERPVVINHEVVIRPMMYVALSYDHRIVDGREAVQFLVRIKELVEAPEALLLEG